MAAEVLKKAADKGVSFLLPEDSIIADQFSNDAAHKATNSMEIPDGWMGLDIGPKARKAFTEAIMAAAERIGLSPQFAQLIAKQTAIGAARMALESEENVAELRRRIPELLYHAAHSRSGAPLLAVALLLDADEAIRTRQLDRLSASFAAEHLALIEKLHTRADQLGAPFRLPLLELAFPALRQRPHDQIEDFVALVDQLIQSDGRVDTFEYLLSRALLSHLRDAEHPGRPVSQRRIKLVNSIDPLHTLFSVVAHLGHARGDQTTARDAYQVGMLALLPNNIDWPDYQAPQQWVRQMDAALDTLDRLPAIAKEELVKALTTTISHDATVTVSEAELLRAVCTILHCPLPPFVLDDQARP